MSVLQKTTVFADGLDHPSVLLFIAMDRCGLGVRPGRFIKSIRMGLRLSRLPIQKGLYSELRLVRIAVGC
jgi:hypothetical protein